jgi:hypothetical protein
MSIGLASGRHYTIRMPPMHRITLIKTTKLSSTTNFMRLDRGYDVVLYHTGLVSLSCTIPAAPSDATSVFVALPAVARPILLSHESRSKVPSLMSIGFPTYLKVRPSISAHHHLPLRRSNNAPARTHSFHTQPDARHASTLSHRRACPRQAPQAPHQPVQGTDPITSTSSR